MAKIIVIGNEKGGCGKTTTAMHLIVTLLKLGFNVGTIDVDSRQQSLTRYIDNRRKTSERSEELNLRLPNHIAITRSQNPVLEDARKEELESFHKALEEMKSCDFIVIDTPGSDYHLGVESHMVADLVITPINDSFVDLDLIGVIDVADFNKTKPGIYAAAVWEQKMKRAAAKSKEVDWVVVRNRLTATNAINKRNMSNALEKLSKRFGFRIVPGFGDRVVFKELFLLGLTLHDAVQFKEIKTSTSVIAARQELRNFVLGLQIPEINERLNNQDKKVS